MDGVKALSVDLGCVEGPLERWQRPAEALPAASPLLVGRNCQREGKCAGILSELNDLKMHLCSGDDSGSKV